VGAQNRRIVTTRVVLGDDGRERGGTLLEEMLAGNAGDDRLERTARAIRKHGAPRRVRLERDQTVIFFRGHDHRARAADDGAQFLIGQRAEKLGARPDGGTFQRFFGGSDTDDFEFLVRERAAGDGDVDALVRQQS